jgi:hypothetical protein
MYWYRLQIKWDYENIQFICIVIKNFGNEPEK